MDLHPGESIVFEGHPSWRGVLSFYVKNIAADLVIAAILWFAWSQTWAVLVFAILVAGTILVGFILRVTTVYTITNERLRIRTGLLSKNVQQTDINRVQNVNTSQGPLERVMQVGRVDFDTAGTDDASFTFEGIANPEDIVKAVDEAKRESPSTPPSAQGL
ncbi:MAG: PH domain-containing protein [Thermoleophilaceae bacterium]|nr:PH domain-containing protein [Thermoleophilaceae bacterium]